MSNQYVDPRPPLEQLQDRVTKLEADVRVASLPASAVDFKIFKNPNKTDEDYAGQMLSTVSSLKYLGRLENFFDWAAGQDEKSDDEKKRKSAKYRRLDAARVRRRISHILAKVDSSEIPFQMRPPIQGDVFDAFDVSMTHACERISELEDERETLLQALDDTTRIIVGLQQDAKSRAKLAGLMSGCVGRCMRDVRR